MVMGQPHSRRVRALDRQQHACRPLAVEARPASLRWLVRRGDVGGDGSRNGPRLSVVQDIVVGHL